MLRNWGALVMYTMISLAIFYVGFQLVNNPSSFLSSIIMTIGIAVLVFGAIYFLFLRNRVGSGSGRNSNEMKKYKQAVKQSKQKYKSSQPIKSNKSKLDTKLSVNSKKKKPKRKNTPNLRVIEGSKSKGKNRATF
ncbi:SA1362 family protein [Halobacillus naozhouensis]|uniref:SA1362 family protein n=1 Tax=Halobacillus naozhouensis TaxID=554880 RepID=A0ABY8IUC6_9BACI|nr:SA1362 family protein [Halobacillus naozhouensis]WFT73231.1 SA1362 family protein [Halobacillus naozhouensis]